jgi:hypothetical protein
VADTRDVDRQRQVEERDTQGESRRRAAASLRDDDTGAVDAALS